MHHLNSFFTSLLLFDIPDPALFILRISRSLTCNIPFLNFPTPLLVFNPLALVLTAFTFCFFGKISPASWASLSLLFCLWILAVSMPFRIRRGIFPFRNSFPPRWDIRESRVRWRRRPWSSQLWYSARMFDSRRRRWRAMSFLRFSVSSSEDATAPGSWMTFFEFADLGNLED